MSERRSVPIDAEIIKLFSGFFDGTPVSAEAIDTSREEEDFRIALIVSTAEGEKYVLKFAANDFTFPARIRAWQRTVEEYRALGYYCPRIYGDKNGEFPKVEYAGRECFLYAEEFSKYRPFEDRGGCDEDAPELDSSVYAEDVWSMTAKIAAKKLRFTEYPSAYCLFETFCPSDETDEVLENALKWKSLAEALPAEFSEQACRIWRLWSENRAALEPLYKRLPTSVFQADLNSTNLLIDEDGAFKGVYDFNLSGRDVFLNYLMRENTADTIPRALEIAAKHYAFSDEERAAAEPLFRCLKPLWWGRISELKKAEGDPLKIKASLDESERLLTAELGLAEKMHGREA